MGGWLFIELITFLEDASKQLADYRFKTQKYEQEIATLQANVIRHLKIIFLYFYWNKVSSVNVLMILQVARLDGQVTRYKTAAEEAESREDDLKIEKRKLQREVKPRIHFFRNTCRLSTFH